MAHAEVWSVMTHLPGIAMEADHVGHALC